MIYTRFADDPAAFSVSKEALPPLAFASVGVDFGGTRSRTTFVCCGFTPGYTAMYVLGEGVLGGDGAGDITSEDVNRAMEAFLCRMHACYTNVPIRYLFCDSEAQ